MHDFVLAPRRARAQSAVADGARARNRKMNRTRSNCLDYEHDSLEFWASLADRQSDKEPSADIDEEFLKGTWM